MGNCGAKKYGNDPNVEDINDATFNSVPALHEGSILGITWFGIISREPFSV